MRLDLDKPSGVRVKRTEDSVEVQARTDVGSGLFLVAFAVACGSLAAALWRRHGLHPDVTNVACAFLSVLGLFVFFAGVFALRNRFTFIVDRKAVTAFQIPGDRVSERIAVADIAKLFSEKEVAKVDKPGNDNPAVTYHLTAKLKDGGTVRLVQGLSKAEITKFLVAVAQPFISDA